MNRQEAYSIVSAALERYRGLSFAELQTRVGTTASEETPSPSGKRYTIDVTVDWSDPQQGALVIRARIDDQSTFRFDPLEEKIRIPHPNRAKT
jgi:hypothetical protein